MQCLEGGLISSIRNFYTVVYLLPTKNSPPLYFYRFKLKFTHSMAYVFAMLFTNWSLTYISYPTQALAKSCKILPVMMGGWFVKHVKYHSLQYVSVCMITGGILMFNLLKAKGGEDSPIGILLLFGSLAMDALNGYATENVRHEIKPSSLEMMSYCNVLASVVTGLIVVLRALVSENNALGFLGKHPDILFDCMLFGGMSAIGQLFIFRGIQVLGSLTLNIVTTTRKFLTVMLSIILFNHTLNMKQWFCLILVFSGTMLDFYVSFFLKARKVAVENKK